MHSLSQIVEMNRRAAAKAAQIETNFNRECSFQGSAKDGVVLHSARFRNTVHLRPGRQAGAFIARWFSTTDQTKRNSIVESYFI